MNHATTSIIATLSAMLFGLMSLTYSPAASAACGGDGQKLCTGIVKAKKVSKARRLGCPGKYNYFSAHKGGSCFSCPKGYKRSLTPIHKKKSCKKIGGRKKVNSKFKGSAWGGCKRGQFHAYKSCYSCPTGTRKRAVLYAFNPNPSCKYPSGGACKGSYAPTKRAPTELGGAKATVCGPKFSVLDAAESFASQSNFSQVSGFIARFYHEYKSDRSPLKNELKARFRRNNAAAAWQLLREYPPFVRLRTSIQNAGGFQSMTIGIVADIQAVKGVNVEDGVAIDVTGATSFRKYRTKGISTGVAAGFDVGINIGLWTVPKDELRGFSQGGVLGGAVGVDFGSGVWYSYYPNSYLGLSLGLGVGVGASAWEFNEVQTIWTGPRH